VRCVRQDVWRTAQPALPLRRPHGAYRVRDMRPGHVPCVPSENPSDDRSWSSYLQIDSPKESFKFCESLSSTYPSPPHPLLRQVIELFYLEFHYFYTGKDTISKNVFV
jgi:hypothetical protein